MKSGDTALSIIALVAHREACVLITAFRSNEAEVSRGLSRAQNQERAAGARRKHRRVYLRPGIIKCEEAFAEPT